MQRKRACHHLVFVVVAPQLLPSLDTSNDGWGRWNLEGNRFPIPILIRVELKIYPTFLFILRFSIK